MQRLLVSLVAVSMLLSGSLAFELVAQATARVQAEHLSGALRNELEAQMRTRGHVQSAYTCRLKESK